MADFRIDCIKSFGPRNARAKMVCRQCRHYVIASQAMLDLMFPKIMPTSWAAQMLRCTKCGARDAYIVPIFPEPR